MVPVVLTSMDQDGRQTGYDLGLTATVSGAVSIPVIASGGVGTLEHLYDGFVEEGKADAVLAASIFVLGPIRLLKQRVICGSAVFRSVCRTT